MAGYEDTKQKIISTLMGRPVGTEIQPENHQDYALNMLDYIRGLELIATSTLIGIAESDTVPVQPNTTRACYIAGIAQDRTVTFENFIDSNGSAISITTSEMEGKFAVLMWDTQHWSIETFDTNIISHADSANFYYSYNIRKTYSSLTAMNNDVSTPIGTDGKTVKIGDLVSVVNSSDSSDNGIYTYEGTSWKFQSSYSFELANTIGTNSNKAISQATHLKSMTSFNVSVLSPTGGVNSRGESGGNLYDLQSAITQLITLVGSNQIRQGVKLCFYDKDDDGRNAEYVYGGLTWRKTVVGDFGDSKVSTIHQAALTERFKAEKEDALSSASYIGTNIALINDSYYDVSLDRLIYSTTSKSSGYLRVDTSKPMLITYTGRTGSGGVIGFDKDKQYVKSIVDVGDMLDNKQYVTGVEFIIVQSRTDEHTEPPTNGYNCTLEVLPKDINRFEPSPSSIPLLQGGLTVAKQVVYNDKRVCTPLLQNIAVTVNDGYKILSVFYFAEDGSFIENVSLLSTSFVDFSNRKFRLTFSTTNEIDTLVPSDSIIDMFQLKSDYINESYSRYKMISFEQGSLSGTNGTNIASTTRIRSNYISKGVFNIKDDYTIITLHKYTMEGVWVSKIALYVQSVIIPNDGFLYRVVISNVDDVSKITPTDNIFRNTELHDVRNLNNETDAKIETINSELFVIKNGVESYSYSLGGITIKDGTNTDLTNRARIDTYITDCIVRTSSGIQVAYRKYEKDGTYIYEDVSWTTVLNLSSEYDWRFIIRRSDDSDIDNIEDVTDYITITNNHVKISLKSLDERVARLEDSSAIEPIQIGKLMSVEPTLRHKIDRTWDYEEFLENTFDTMPLEKVNIGKTTSYNQADVYDVFGYVYTPPRYTKTCVLTANIHGGERESAYTAANVMDIILNRAWMHKDIQYIKDNVRLLIVPISNPYGFNRDVANYQQSGWGWRVYQNNARNCNMNRNWDFGWDNSTINNSSSDFIGNDRMAEGNVNVWNFIKPYYNELSFWFDLHQGTYYAYRYWMSGATQERINPIGQSALDFLRKIAASKSENTSVLQTLSLSSTTAAFGTHVCCIPAYTLENNSLPESGAYFTHFSASSITNFAEYVLNMIHLHARNSYNPRLTRSTDSFFRSRLLPAPVSQIFGDMYNDSSSDILDRFEAVYSQSEALTKISLSNNIGGYLLDKTEDYQGDIIILGGLNIGAESRTMQVVQENATSNLTASRTITLGIKHVYSLLHLLGDMAGDVQVDDVFIQDILRKYKLHIFPLCNADAIDNKVASDVTSSVVSDVEIYIGTLEKYSRTIIFNEIDVTNGVVEVEYNTEEVNNSVRLLAECETLSYSDVNTFSFVGESIRINFDAKLVGSTEYTTDQGTFYASLLINSML